MISSPGARSTAAASLAVLALFAAACTSDSAKKASATSSVPVTSSSVPATTAAPAKPAPKNPFTGVGPVPRNPVIAVKIDDTEPGRPQVAIDQADIVYIEAVEGGLTRLAAVFATHMPKKVGYVRSTRPSDPDLLLQYGKITEAYSGGAHDSLPRVRKSGITSWSNDAGAAYYFRAPHAGDHGYINLALNLAQVAKRTKTNRPRSNGWTFSPSLAGLTTQVGTNLRTVVTGSNRGGTSVQFKWNPKIKKYVRYIDGVAQHAADGSLVSATNVIVQFCRVVAHPADTDVNGNPSQFTYTVGKGKVAVFRQARRVDGTWSRPTASAGTALLTAAGKPLPLNPGNTWVVLATRGAPLQG
ncbi:DUF3048 domain-containing protein [uncultured Jatrophihabitans sp.]|uniref:DUF3048 domain-containing protein n=1 Tax=uncultured Jatrophihabitans sp. TaxID=1610747 RepID=UPI0035CA9A86